MIFNQTPLKDAFTIDLEKRGDERGFFARVFCENEFKAAGCPDHFVQVNNSSSADVGTLRGMHYQLGDEFAETKVVRCIKGALWDCIIDLRPDSPTFKQWFGETLSAENRKMMMVPRGFAHGFITLEPDTEAFYFVDNFYAPDSERGIRYNDPEFNIQWPTEPKVLSDKDQGWRDFDPRTTAVNNSPATRTTPMHILFTGGSSFTGYWFIKQLHEAGHTVTATFTRKNPTVYADGGVREQRIARVQEHCTRFGVVRLGTRRSSTRSTTGRSICCVTTRPT